MTETLMYKVQNLFNGEMIVFENRQNALDYVKVCMLRQIPISIDYGNKIGTMAQNEKKVVPKIVA